MAVGAVVVDFADAVAVVAAAVVVVGASVVVVAAAVVSRCQRTCDICNCRDDVNDCARLVTFCGNPMYQPVLRPRCTLTCGFCSNDTGKINRSDNNNSSANNRNCSTGNHNCSTKSRNCSTDNHDCDTNNHNSRDRDNDSGWDCERYARMFFTEPYSTATEGGCQKTCNICNGRDSANNCGSVVSYFGDPTLQPVLRSRCPLSCGFCS
ncbi:unnamed protein product [Toxocara canis]|uniref:ShKT domain-containing protein n=1 Tax=Toxocara canis TaxID=6265 RepID=A0A183U550_TOXCA|nr:unnamed protein product [Toxocara canis]